EALGPGRSGEGSGRYAHDGPQAAHRAVAERDVAAMAAGDVAGDGKPEPGAAVIEVTRFVETHERLEDVLAARRRNAGTVIVDDDGQRTARMHRLDLDVLGIAQRIADDVGKQPVEGLWPHM